MSNAERCDCDDTEICDLHLSASASRAADAGGPATELPKHNVYPKSILDDVLVLLAGQKFPTPEKGFTGWDDALSSLKRLIRERAAAPALNARPSKADALPEKCVGMSFV